MCRKLEICECVGDCKLQLGDHRLVTANSFTPQNCIGEEKIYVARSVGLQ